MTSAENALLITLADLTRCCCANENYFAWLSSHTGKLRAKVANYLALAAEVFEHQARAQRGQFDELNARDQLADILMESEPLTVEALQATVAQCIRENRFEQEAA